MQICRNTFLVLWKHYWPIISSNSDLLSDFLISCHRCPVGTTPSWEIWLRACCVRDLKTGLMSNLSCGNPTSKDKLPCSLRPPKSKWQLPFGEFPFISKDIYYRDSCPTCFFTLLFDIIYCLYISTWMIFSSGQIVVFLLSYWKLLALSWIFRPI